MGVMRTRRRTSDTRDRYPEWMTPDVIPDGPEIIHRTQTSVILKG